MNTKSPKDELQLNTPADESRLGDAGFRWGDMGTHTSQTIMLDERKALPGRICPDETRQDYIANILHNNCLGELTVTTRRLTGQRLAKLYGLDPGVPLFRMLRPCWYANRTGHAGHIAFALMQWKLNGIREWRLKTARHYPQNRWSVDAEIPARRGQFGRRLATSMRCDLEASKNFPFLLRFFRYMSATPCAISSSDRLLTNKEGWAIRIGHG